MINASRQMDDFSAECWIKCKIIKYCTSLGYTLLCHSELTAPKPARGFQRSDGDWAAILPRLQVD